MIEGELGRLMGRVVSIGEQLIRQSCAASIIPLNAGERFGENYLTRLVETCRVQA